MSLRSLAFLIFGLTILIILHRDRSSHSIIKHKPAPPVTLSINQTIRPYYKIGPLRDVNLPKPTFLDLFTRKKIDNFIFNHYNHYKLEFTFVDLGYTNNLMFSFFSEEYPAYRVTEKVGFDLSQNMIDGSLNLDLKKKYFNLTVRQYINHQNHQTVTTFNVSLLRLQSSLQANLTHVIRNKQCFTAVRKSNIISHKCFGGFGSGKVKIDRILRDGGQPRKQTNMLNPSNNLTRSLYDGLRGSGLHWRWVWGEMNGFSKPQFYALNHTIPIQHWLGLNFGHIFGQGQDFAFIDGKVIPIQGLSYTFNEKAKLKSNITVKASNPRLQANFTILSLQKFEQDSGIFKLDMVKAEGDWSGWIQREDGKIYEFYSINGLIESCDSLF